MIHVFCSVIIFHTNTHTHTHKQTQTSNTHTHTNTHSHLFSGSHEKEQIWPLGIISSQESYDEIKSQMGAVLQDLHDISKTGLDVNGTHKTIEFFLGGDMKASVVYVGVSVGNVSH